MLNRWGQVWLIYFLVFFAFIRCFICWGYTPYYTFLNRCRPTTRRPANHSYVERLRLYCVHMICDVACIGSATELRACLVVPPLFGGARRLTRPRVHHSACLLPTEPDSDTNIQRRALMTVRLVRRRYCNDRRFSSSRHWGSEVQRQTQACAFDPRPHL